MVTEQKNGNALVGRQLTPTLADYEALIQANEGLHSPLANIIMARLLNEKDAEIELLASRAAQDMNGRK